MDSNVTIADGGLDCSIEMDSSERVLVKTEIRSFRLDRAFLVFDSKKIARGQFLANHRDDHDWDHVFVFRTMV